MKVELDAVQHNSGYAGVGKEVRRREQERILVYFIYRFLFDPCNE